MTLDKSKEKEILDFIPMDEFIKVKRYKVPEGCFAEIESAGIRVYRVLTKKEIKMDSIEKGFLGLAIIVIVLSIGLYFLSTRIEQNTFNKFSKTKATFVEAMFTNLRVIPD